MMSKKDLEKSIQIILDSDYKEMENLRDTIADLAKQNRKLHNKIDKAINYIKEQGCYDEDCNVFCNDLNYYAIPRLLEILKDSDVDE